MCCTAGVQQRVTAPWRQPSHAAWRGGTPCCVSSWIPNADICCRKQLNGIIHRCCWLQALPLSENSSGAEGMGGTSPYPGVKAGCWTKQGCSRPSGGLLSVLAFSPGDSWSCAGGNPNEGRLWPSSCSLQSFTEEYFIRGAFLVTWSPMAWLPSLPVTHGTLDSYYKYT